MIFEFETNLDGERIPVFATDEPICYRELRSEGKCAFGLLFPSGKESVEAAADEPDFDDIERLENESEENWPQGAFLYEVPYKELCEVSTKLMDQEIRARDVCSGWLQLLRQAVDQDYLKLVACRCLGRPQVIANVDCLGESCVLRELAEQDVDAEYIWYDTLSETERPYISGPLADRAAEAERIRDYRDCVYSFWNVGFYGLFDRKGQMLGCFGAEMDENGLLSIGYALIPSMRGQGIAYSCMEAVLAHASDQGYERYSCKTAHNNTASIRLVERLKQCGYAIELELER